MWLRTRLKNLSNPTAVIKFAWLSRRLKKKNISNWFASCKFLKLNRNKNVSSDENFKNWYRNVSFKVHGKDFNIIDTLESKREEWVPCSDVEEKISELDFWCPTAIFDHFSTKFHPKSNFFLTRHSKNFVLGCWQRPLEWQTPRGPRRLSGAFFGGVFARIWRFSLPAPVCFWLSCPRPHDVISLTRFSVFS